MRSLVSLLAGPVVLLSVIAPAAGAAWNDGHDRCGSCHLDAADRPGRGAADRCTGCHAGTLAAELAGASQPTSGHVGAGPALACTACHDPHDGALTVAEASAATGALDAASRACVTCHRTRLDRAGDAGQFNHPVGLTLPAALHARATLPLADVHGTADAADDVIACTTCHTVHVGAHPSLLRWAASAEAAACAGCHGDVGGTAVAAIGRGTLLPERPATR
jgi:predicted CXXCH cytochrome family protein